MDIGKFMVARQRALPDEQHPCDASATTDNQTTHTTDSEICHSPNTNQGEYSTSLHTEHRLGNEELEKDDKCMIFISFALSVVFLTLNMPR